MNRNFKSVCMGVGYALAFHVLGWGAAALYVEGVLSRIAGLFLFFALLLALVPAYFFAMDRVKKQWIFRLAAALSFALLCVLAFFLADRLATGFLDDLEYFLLGYVMILAMAVIFLLDALILVIRHAKRQRRDRSA